MATTTAGSTDGGERPYHYSSRLCTTNVKDFFPFPLMLAPKAWNCKDGEYVVPDDVMNSMYSEFKVHQRNKLKIKLNRKLQLDYHQKEFVLYSNDDLVVTRSPALNIIRVC
eukprot:TRINITY_DN5759_c0_g1_i2.p1 TRINITY_DN5759_c0_g1~~TRINITY_DN5759_c0_g1_i2.p1  ORF type:complete len:111 (+),score=1.45 TRINITY_DN5759_c0_g1_i2:678-1010(+)